MSNAPFAIALSLGWLVACSRPVERPAAEAAAAQPTDSAAMTSETPSTGPLTGTSWKLVRFQSMNDKVLTPDDRSKYMLAFGADGRASIKADCNRGSGTWTSSADNVLSFGPIASTRAMCPPGSMSAQFLRDFEYMRTYILKDGMLHVSLMADGGIYDFEPATDASAPAQ